MASSRTRRRSWIVTVRADPDDRVGGIAVHVHDRGEHPVDADGPQLRAEGSRRPRALAGSPAAPRPMFGGTSVARPRRVRTWPPSWSAQTRSGIPVRVSACLRVLDPRRHALGIVRHPGVVRCSRRLRPRPRRRADRTHPRPDEPPGPARTSPRARAPPASGPRSGSWSKPPVASIRGHTGPLMPRRSLVGRARARPTPVPCRRSLRREIAEQPAVVQRLLGAGRRPGALPDPSPPRRTSPSRPGAPPTTRRPTGSTSSRARPASSPHWRPHRSSPGTGPRRTSRGARSSASRSPGGARRRGRARGGPRDGRADACDHERASVAPRTHGPGTRSSCAPDESAPSRRPRRTPRHASRSRSSRRMRRSGAAGARTRSRGSSRR